MDINDIKHIQNSIEEFKERLESLEAEIEFLQQNIWDVENEIEPFVYGIKDVSDFIFRAKADSVLSPEMEEWIERYMRFHNE